MINNSGFLYNGGNKFQLMLIFQDEYNKRTDIWFNIIWNNCLNISSPNSCSDLFSSLQFWKSDVACPVVFDKDFWKGDFYVDVHIRKFWINPVAIFKLLFAFSWFPSSQNLLHFQRLMH